MTAGTPGQAACIAWNSHHAERYGIEARSDWAASGPRERGAWEAAAQAGHDAIAARQPQPAPGETRTCYCGTSATVVTGVFPHPDCDGSVPASQAQRDFAAWMTAQGYHADYRQVCGGEQMREAFKGGMAAVTGARHAAELAMLRADLADAEAQLAKWPKCPAGCSCRVGVEDDADRNECGCDGPCNGGTKAAAELAAVTEEAGDGG